MSRMRIEALPPSTARKPAPPIKKPVARKPVRIVQPKLAVGRADCRYEREADRVADRVLAMTEPTAQRKQAGDPAIAGGRLSDEAPAPEILRQPAAVDTDVEAGDSLVSNLGGGRALDSIARTYFEPRFGADFSKVRVHDGAAADTAARSIDALAFTSGTNIAFRSGHYSPGHSAGRRLLAHELAHVVQQRGAAAVVQREVACPSREPGETARSKTPAGILASDVVYVPSKRLDVVDFAVDSASLPEGVTESAPWQEAMSLIVGDPSTRIRVEGLTDCLGTAAGNLDLSQLRAQAVIAAMPAGARSKVLPGLGGTTAIDTNATEQGRAHNRAVRITFSSAAATPNARESFAQAANLDEYLFLVRTLERRLNLTSPQDAPNALSVLRQIYYGTSGWSRSENTVWDNVIPEETWSSWTSPIPALGTALYGALLGSQVVEGIDIGHILTGIDAMMNPVAEVEVLKFGSIALPNEEWATWAGDVGSAAAGWAWDSYRGRENQPSPLEYFQALASDADLLGDIGSFALRAGGTNAAPAAQLGQRIALAGTLSETLLQYFRITGSKRGIARADSVRIFVEAYGGVIAGRSLVNRADFVRRLRPSVSEFAQLMIIERQAESVFASKPANPPDLVTLRALGTAAMTELFVRWLEARIKPAPPPK